jgi:alpha-ketoglutarate-dependent taurine dioxygenase
MSTMTVTKLTEHIGAEVTGADVDRLLNDDSLPQLLMDALSENGVLVFPELGLEPDTQVAFSQRLGQVDLSPGEAYNEPGIMRVSLDPNISHIETLRGTFNWHMDGCTLPPGQHPGRATVLTAVALAERGGQTEFASTYALYDSLTTEERERLGNLRVVHSILGTRRRAVPDRTPEQEAIWAQQASREHPLFWEHRSGRCSVVIGGTTERVVGMDLDAGVALLDELVERATTVDRVYRHEWSLGDTVIWDNPGLLHRVEPYADDSPRQMIRSSLLGDEPIQSPALAPTPT